MHTQRTYDIFPCYVYTFLFNNAKSDNLEAENYADSRLSFIVLYSDNLRHSGMDLWVFPPFRFIFKGIGGWERISEDSVLNRLLFCSFFYLLTVSNALCLMQFLSLESLGWAS